MITQSTLEDCVDKIDQINLMCYNGAREYEDPFPQFAWALGRLAVWDYGEE